MKYHIPQIPYNIAIPNTGGSNPPPPSRLPQHLRSAVAGGLCRLQSVADTPVPSSNPWSDSDPPDPLAAREEQLIGQLIAQLESRPGRHTPRQIIIQALQCYLNDGVTANPPTAPPQAGQHPAVDTTTSASAACVAHTVRPAEIVRWRRLDPIGTRSSYRSRPTVAAR